MKCEKCERDITEQWENNITYKGEEEHHNPPQFMLDNWRGTLHNLCVDCHDDLHKEIIKIFKKETKVICSLVLNKGKKK